MKILEEFWYGNIEPMEYNATPSKEYTELLQLICRNEEKLQATFTDEQKDLFSRYVDCGGSYRQWQTVCCFIAATASELG